MINRNKMKPASGQAGISVLEIAIALILLSLIMAPIIASFKQQLIDDHRNNTLTNLQIIDKALQNYYTSYNKLPCPADPTLTEASPLYGQQQTVCSTNPPPPAGTGPITVTGAVPFSDLHIPAEATFDGWQIKIAYTVTSQDTTIVSLADPNSKSVTINEFDALGNPSGNTTAFYVLVSYGEDGLGGYTNAGVLAGACPIAAAWREQENCNGDATFLDNTNIRSTAAGTNYLDDIILYDQALGPGIWTYVPKGLDNSAGFQDIWTQDYVGVGTNNPTTFLDVGGTNPGFNLRATGSAGATELCDQAGSNCFSAAMLAGPGGAPGSGSGVGVGNSNPVTSGCQNTNAGGGVFVVTAMTAIKNGDAACSTQSPFTGHAATCPPGKYVQTIDPAGDITCGP